MKDGELSMLRSTRRPRIMVDIIMTAFRMIRDTEPVQSRRRALVRSLFAAK